MMVKTMIAASLIFAAACGAQAVGDVAPPPAAGAWRVDTSKSSIGFSGTQTGNAFEGKFSGYDIDIVFDPKALDAARIDATINVGSAATGDRQRDAALPTSDWFSQKAFPTARFVSDNVTATADGAYEAKGAVSIRGVERPLTLPFTIAIDGDRAVADAAVTLNRTDFGVGQGEFATGEWVGLDVKVAIHIEATR